MAFFKDRIQHLSENSKSLINFGFGESKELLKDKITRMENGTLLGVIGPFGSGKSTAINQIRTELEDIDNKWVEIDTWQFPNRQELWEGMIYKMAGELGINEGVIGNTIDGHQKQSTGFIGAVSGVASLGLTDKFFNLLIHPPMKRVHELQNFLKEIVNNYPKNIIIILEDVDRAGESGLFFIETVSLFFKENFPSKNIKVLVPISDKSYEKSIDIYSKCFDYSFNFIPTYNAINSFLENITNDGAYGKIGRDCKASQCIPEVIIKNHLENFFTEIILKGFTPRDVRTILRNADISHDWLIGKGLAFPDIRLLIAIAASNTTLGKSMLSIKTSGHLSAGNSLGKLIIASAANNATWNSIGSERGFNYKVIPITISDDNYGGAWINDNELLIPDFYLGY